MSFTESLADLVAGNRNGLLSIHPSWTRVPLGTIAEIQNGFPFESARFSASTGTPLIRIRDIVGGTTETYFNGEFDKSFLVSSGDLLVGMDGDFNCSEWRGGSALLNQRVCRLLKRSDGYSWRFLRHALPGYLAAINAATSSITVKHLSSRTIAEIPLPLPPLAEQHRIVAKIESLLGELDKGVAALERAKESLARYRMSVRQAAVTGELTAEWRAKNPPTEDGKALLARILRERREKWEKDQLSAYKAKGKEPPKGWREKYDEPSPPDASELPEVPDGWHGVTLGQLITTIETGVSYKCLTRKADAHEWGVVKVSAMSWGCFLEDEQKALPPSVEPDPDTEIASGDLLMSRCNTEVLVGATVLVGKTRSRLLLSDKSLRLKPEPVINRVWLHLALCSPLIRNQLSAMATGTKQSMRNISQEKILSAELPLPPSDEQRVIADLVQQRLATISASEATINAQMANADTLRQSILKAAFEGRLVSQDSNDEPASVLLERIKASMPSPQPKKSKRQKVKVQ